MNAARVGRASPKSEGRVTNQARRPNSRPGACGFALQRPMTKSQESKRPAKKDKVVRTRDKSKGEGGNDE